ncbi:NmrA family NAD(P)-binding protein [Runella slithyformis]|uniref:NAD-dependent epimerase/dehydratase n=1 Tax=Runella slithyformis (strain ATCC 29530 / DSM 19594 / LMG 11500 / NCIMB 11436 / LSU 4) TaxID=761193 RepID=A0A7U3ZGE7_RUNSL|nr:NAD(P)H-binding protein [Runella slithyformis]AEI46672.1 NAD-dependent epimerase/dehydratase [Runella slithyformis DSM 19594]
MYVITGATGNTGHAIAEALLAAGKEVKAVVRNAAKGARLAEKGAQLAIGTLEDAAFLKETFNGADAVYLLIPPKWDVKDWRAYQREIIQNFVEALQDSGVKYAVVLSSMGAHMPTGAGPVSGLYELEQALKTVGGLNVLNLRAAYFMENFYGNIGMIKAAGIQGYALRSDLKMPLVHTRDIAALAIRHLLALDFEGHSHVFVAGAADYTMPEATAVLSAAVGQPFYYVQFSPADARAGMLGAGIPETIADGYNELFDGLNSGEYLKGYERNADNTTPTTLEEFAKNEFAPAFKA